MKTGAHKGLDESPPACYISSHCLAVSSVEPAYDKAIRNLNEAAALLGGKEGIRTTPATAIEITNLTHLAIRLSLEDSDGGILEDLKRLLPPPPPKEEVDDW